jgi:DNA helicase-2/ATP-dependent DNA helicase PcrA
MEKQPPPIEDLWKKANFTPNREQEEAIRHIDGPLFLAAGPGSGKTRVLLWRTLNLIVYQNIDPDKIFLATFTEKAAIQLKEGLLSYLALVTNKTGKAYDVSAMSIGTVHSICQKLLSDRRFSKNRSRNHPPALMDEFGQYFFVYRHSFWDSLCAAAGFSNGDEGIQEVNRYFGNPSQGEPSKSRHKAAIAIIALFNRFSEEYLDPETCAANNKTLATLLKMYGAYMKKLDDEKKVDFSLLQKKAYDHISAVDESGSIFKHIIVDEYQDTNTIQEKLFFTLAAESKNICVVGDDDQALYRFRGATVENLVQFENRCEEKLSQKARRIDLSTNYRSRMQIVKTYTDFIELTNWKNPSGGACRVENKNIKANSADSRTSVVVSELNDAAAVYRDIVEFVYKLKQEGKISDYSECAFLFPAIRGWDGAPNTRVKGFMDAFRLFNDDNSLTGTDDEIKIYAPRAGRFLDLEEARAVWGMMLLVFNRPSYGAEVSRDLGNFRTWLENCKSYAKEICDKDKQLAEFIEDRITEVETAGKDYEILNDAIAKNGLENKTIYEKSMTRILSGASGISQKAKRSLTNKFFNNVVEARAKEGAPFTIDYIINRACSLDWSVLDFFYQLTGFEHFRKMIDLAENHGDEGPICNLALIADYLFKFQDQYGPVISAGFLHEGKFSHSLYSSFTYALWRLAETEFEDKDDPFPKGRVSFLTIHQSKGLEFPVVVLGSLFRREGEADIKEKIIRDLLHKHNTGEPLERITKFDTMRVFYVALSRAENLLILPQYTRAKAAIEEFKELIENSSFKEIKEFNLREIDIAKRHDKRVTEVYSYTSDYLLYKRCPRHYMFLREYEFAGSRTQTMMFGSLVHQTIEDLHQLLIDQRSKETRSLNYDG